MGYYNRRRRYTSVESEPVKPKSEMEIQADKVYSLDSDFNQSNQMFSGPDDRASAQEHAEHQEKQIKKIEACETERFKLCEMRGTPYAPGHPAGWLPRIIAIKAMWMERAEWEHKHKGKRAPLDVGIHHLKGT